MCLWEVMRDVRKAEYLSDIEGLFPCADWKVYYTKGVNGGGVSGTGILTAVKLAKGKDCSVEFLEYPETTPEIAHKFTLKMQDLEYNIFSYYLKPGETQLGAPMIDALKWADLSLGDMNRTIRPGYSVRGHHYENVVDEHTLVELIQVPTCIPIRGTEPTTTPDSALTNCKYNESIFVCRQDTLSSDHLAFLITSDFQMTDVEREYEEYYYDMESMSVEMRESVWAELPEIPVTADILRCEGKLALMCRRKGGNKRRFLKR